MKYCSRLMMKLFVIAFTLGISLNNDTYQVKADDKNLSSADYYIKESFEKDKNHAKRHSDHQQIRNKIEQTIEFYVRKQNNRDVSHMDEYVKHPGYIVNDGNQTYFVMTLLNREWWESYKFYQHDKELKVSIVNEDKEQDTVTIQIPLINIKEEVKSRIHIKIPSIHYDHTYTTCIVMKHSEKNDEKVNHKDAQNNKSNQFDDKESLRKNLKTEEGQFNEIKNENSHLKESKQSTQQDMSSNQIINREEQNKFSNSNSNLSIKPSTDKPSSDSLNRTNSNTPASLNTNTNSRYSRLPQLNPFKKEKDKPNPSFNRDADKKKVAKKDHNEDVLPNHRNTYYLLGSVILLAILALIATYFVKRKSESKK